MTDHPTPLITITFLMTDAQPGRLPDMAGVAAYVVHWYHVPRAGDTVSVPGVEEAWGVTHVHWEDDGRRATVWLGAAL